MLFCYAPDVCTPLLAKGLLPHRSLGQRPRFPTHIAYLWPQAIFTIFCLLSAAPTNIHMYTFALWKLAHDTARQRMGYAAGIAVWRDRLRRRRGSRCAPTATLFDEKPRGVCRARPVPFDRLTTYVDTLSPSAKRRVSCAASSLEAEKHGLREHSRTNVSRSSPSAQKNGELASPRKFAVAYGGG